MEVNERLKAVRTALNLSQRAFCKGIYTSQSFYAKMEQGKMLINDRIIEFPIPPHCTSCFVFIFCYDKDSVREGFRPIFIDPGRIRA